MASNFYDKHLPDYGDLDNQTGNCPGFAFGVRENDGGIGLYVGPIADGFDGDTFYRAFLNPDEADELAYALKQAIERARSKGGSHPLRVK
jgi:hypothetical protein